MEICLKIANRQINSIFYKVLKQSITKREEIQIVNNGYKQVVYRGKKL